jgi:hypothetical protein
MNYYQTQTGINPTQFFNQWYYGQGYPTFNVKGFVNGNTFTLQSTQTTSFPSSVPLFITPMEYKLSRTGFPDTNVRVMHSNAVENYTFNLQGTVTAIVCDPNNWVINKVTGPTLSYVGINENENNNVWFKIGPNPTKGIINIYNTENKKGSIKITDVAGKLIFEKKIESEITFDLNNYPNGVYLINYFDTNNSKCYAQKIIKE